MSNPNDPIVVYSGNSFEADLVKNELENNGIPAFLKDEIIGTLTPWHAAPGGAGAVKVTVPVKDSEEAFQIIQRMGRSSAE